MLDFRPDFVFVIDIVVQFDHDITHPVLGSRDRLVSFYLLVGHQELFERFGQLFLDFFSRSSGIQPHDNPLTDGIFRTFLFGDPRQGIDPENKKASNNKESNAEIPHGPCYDVVRGFHCNETLEP